MRCSILAALFVFPLSPAPAQEPPPRSLVDLAQTVRDLDALMAEMSHARERARQALQMAQKAETCARADGLDEVAQIAAELRVQLDGLGAAVDQHVDALRVLRERAVLQLPAELLGPLVRMREQVLAASRLPTLAEAEAELVRLEGVLAQEIEHDAAGAEVLLAFARYRLADVLRQRAAFEVDVKKNDKDAEKLLRRASQKFAEVLDGPDHAEDSEGSSLHAAALRRIVQVETALYAGYLALSAARRGGNVAAQARRHREAAQQAFERLGRVYPDAILPDGSRLVEAARADVQHLMPR